MQKYAITTVLTTLYLLTVSLGYAAAAEVISPPLRAAIFVQNSAGIEYKSQIDPLTNQLAARLSEKGFSIIDRRDVIGKFSESRETDPAAIKAAKALEQLARDGKSDSRLEDALTGASAHRIARQLGADYLIMATINSMSRETKSFKGQGTVYGTNNSSHVYTIRVAVKVLEGSRGGAIYGDIVAASERIALVENLEIATDDIYPRLVDAAAIKVAENISSKVERIASVKVAPPEKSVKFIVTSNIQGATVELDGAALGSAPGTFYAEPGIHTLRVTKEWLTNWERTVNISANQTINVGLELSDEGIQRYMTLERFKAEVSIAKEQSEASAYATKQIAEGEKKKRSQSYERLNGVPTTNVIVR